MGPTQPGGPVFDIDVPPIRVEPTYRWVRVRVGGTWVADSRRALLLVWYGPFQLPTYCFPAEDVRMELIALTADRARDGVSTRADIQANGDVLRGAARVFVDPPPELAAARDHVSFVWHDQRLQWFEESQQIHVHARDPHTRVDAVPSSRQVRIELDGETVAESNRPVALFETSLPTRWYLPVEDARQDMLVPTDTVTMCPYKGVARWWSVRTRTGAHPDIVWSYRDTVVECPHIAGLVAFLNERVDLILDGDLQRRPFTPWSLEPGAAH